MQTIDDALGEVFSVERMNSARIAVESACLAIPVVAKLKVTPQTLPEHGEGPFVIDHLVRMFAIIDAIVAGVSFVACGEVADDPILRLAIIDAERAIHSSPDVFRAYALMHNIAKPDRLLLVAEVGTSGEKEGFVALDRRVSPYSTSSELVRFDKLRRAGLAEGIVATFDDADRAVIGPQYAEVREAIVGHCGLENAFVKFVAELCWSHDDVARYFVEPGNEDAFAIFSARAGKSGLNVEKFLDALLAIALIDHDLGRIRSSSERLVFHQFVLAEYATLPERHAAREARERHNQKLRVKQILAESGLDPEEVFLRLGTGFGAERGEVMRRVYGVIRGEIDASSFGAHSSVIQIGAERAAALLAKEGLSV
ncbi:MAG: hypothetical protein WCT28_04435 [Patescibacteria group bacterium]|jgi:hypothetical protein